VVLLALVLTFGWAALAQAQEGSAGDQYGNPADIPTVTASDSGSASAASDPGSASAASGGSALSATTLPLTGGASLIALGAGVLLVGGGLVARRMIR